MNDNACNNSTAGRIVRGKLIVYLLPIHQLTALMKKIALIILCFLPFLTLHAQITEGTYKEANDSLSLDNQYAIFSLKGFAGLSVAQVGEGKYELEGEILTIHTGDYSGNKSSSQSVPAALKDTCIVEVVELNSYPLSTILVEARSPSGKLLDAKVTDQEGKVYLKDLEKIGTITVSELGYHSHQITYEKGKDFQVQLAENDIIENKEVLFRYRMVDEETLSLLMLSDDFKEGKNRERDIQKLLKKAEKSNKFDKRLKKVYVPYERKF